MDHAAVTLPGDWGQHLAAETAKPYYRQLLDFVAAERQRHDVFPPPANVFETLRLTPFQQVKVLILGQDPYHGVGQSHGLCFSVKPGVKPPPSLVNIFKELHADLGVAPPTTGCLSAWATQGVLLLNAILTVRSGEPLSHKGRGWETFTDAIIKMLSDRPQPMVFVLWGGPAKKKQSLIDASRHVILSSAHPSPLSAHNGFFGSKPFSQINAALDRWGQSQIDWRLT